MERQFIPNDDPVLWASQFTGIVLPPPAEVEVEAEAVRGRGRGHWIYNELRLENVNRRIGNRRARFQEAGIPNMPNYSIFNHAILRRQPPDIDYLITYTRDRMWLERWTDYRQLVRSQRIWGPYGYYRCSNYNVNRAEARALQEWVRQTVHYDLVAFNQETQEQPPARLRRYIAHLIQQHQQQPEGQPQPAVHHHDLNVDAILQVLAWSPPLQNNNVLRRQVESLGLTVQQIEQLYARLGEIQQIRQQIPDVDDNENRHRLLEEQLNELQQQHENNH